MHWLGSRARRWGLTGEWGSGATKALAHRVACGVRPAARLWAACCRCRHEEKGEAKLVALPPSHESYGERGAAVRCGPRASAARGGVSVLRWWDVWRWPAGGSVPCQNGRAGIKRLVRQGQMADYIAWHWIWEDNYILVMDAETRS